MTINVRIKKGAEVVITEEMILETLRLREAGEEINVLIDADASVVVTTD